MQFSETNILDKENAASLIKELCEKYPQWLEWMGFSKEQITNKDICLFTKAEISTRKKIQYIAIGKIVEEVSPCQK